METRGAQPPTLLLEYHSFSLAAIQNNLFLGGFLTLPREMPEEDMVYHLATKQGLRNFALLLITSLS